MRWMPCAETIASIAAAAGADALAWQPGPEATYEELLQLEDVKVTAPPSSLHKLRTCIHGLSDAACIKETACLVCQEDWETGDKLATLPCEHVFHETCVVRWLREYSNKCPVCKAALR
jgi:hypothetical protein